MNRKFLLAISLFLLTATLSAQQKATVSIDTKSAGSAIPDDFLGLSFESLATLPDNGGQYRYFRPDNQPLVQLFRTLGIKNLRIGGNTSDRPTVKVPSQADIDSVYAFARAAGVKVIYTLRLRDSTPNDVVPIAKYVMDRYKAETLCLTVGNEPNIYEKEYPKYRDDLRRYMETITAAAPEAKFCGPATTPGTGGWAADFAADFGPSGKVVEVTQHSYPGGNGRKVTDAAVGRKQLLSADFAKHYETLYQAFVPAVRKNGLTYRLEETNNFYNGGTKDVSNTFASALWGLDYLYWWAAHEARGVNFHTGDAVAAGEQQAPCWYATFWSAPNGYTAHPLAYGIKAFDLGSHGRLLPVRVSPASASLSAYAVLGADGTAYITLINKGADPSAAVNIRIDSRGLHGETAALSLAAPQSDIAAHDGIMLGGSSISPDGVWSGTWKPLKKKAGAVVLNLAPASATIVRIGQ